MRTPAFHRRMALLALAAMLLLLALPTVGRVLAGSSADAQGVWAQMCTMAGLKLVKIAPDTSPIDPPAPKPMPGDDCAYCPVLGGLVLLLAWTLFAAPQQARTTSPSWRTLLPRTFEHPSGLGSRGPPIAL